MMNNKMSQLKNQLQNSNSLKNGLTIVLASLLLIISQHSHAQGENAQAAPVMSEQQIQMTGFTESTIPSRDLAGYRPLKRVLVPLAGPQQIAMLQSVAPEVEFVSNSNPGTVNSDQGGEQKFDAVFVSCAFPSALSRAKQAAWIHSFSAGVEGCLAHPTVRALEQQESDYIITNSRGTAASVIGEHAIAMMMSHSRGLHHFRDAQSKNDWIRNQAISGGITTTIGGKTMLVLGLGSIGKEVARRANALGMRVIATRNSSRQGPDYVDYVGLGDETLKLAAQADVVVNSLPSTAATRGLLDNEFFKAMKSTAILVSVGRGTTTVTADLIEALEDGQLAGAALDVMDPEPLPADHPLWNQPNVIITPHLAGTGGGARANVFRLVVENVRRYQAGEPLLNPVSSKAGY